MFRPIYTPSGPALEYAQYGLNIYDSCPHGCTYCYARTMAARFGKPWGDTVNVRPGLMDALWKQLASKEWRNAGRLIHLCFTCDPYPVGYDSITTREVIRVIKASGNHVQLLTKGDTTAQRDFDLLDNNDRFGVTLTGSYVEEKEPNAASALTRIVNLIYANKKQIPTWASCEPVLDTNGIMKNIYDLDFVSTLAIGTAEPQQKRNGLATVRP